MESCSDCIPEFLEAKVECSENQIVDPLTGEYRMYFDIPQIFFYHLVDSENTHGVPEALKIIGALCYSEYETLERYKLRIRDLIDFSLNQLIMPLFRSLDLPHLELVQVEKKYITFKDSILSGKMYSSLLGKLKISNRQRDLVVSRYSSQIKKINTLDSLLHQQFRDRIEYNILGKK